MLKDYSHIIAEVYDDAERIVMSNLQGVQSRKSFDLFKVDYFVEQDTIEYRIKNIVEDLIRLVASNIERGKHGT